MNVTLRFKGACANREGFGTGSCTDATVEQACDTSTGRLSACALFLFKLKIQGDLIDLRADRRVYPRFSTVFHFYIFGPPTLRRKTAP